MKIIIKYFFFVLVFTKVFTAFSQHNKIFELQSLDIKDSSFFFVLDQFILNEKKCNYYNSNLLVEIGIQSINDSVYQVVLSSFGEKNKKSNRDFGCFIYDGHLFIVSKSRNEKDLDLLFKKTNEKQKIKLTKTKKERLIILDDSYTIWTFYYKNGIYMSSKRESSCHHDIKIKID